ncbi:MAG TPA: transcriptional repressor [Spirochaetota bacterium]|nr:transcriptional repressor [Spirochaetota bacterium]HOL57579.1 transcriptional repressor [Spirochaetota bacterium]HPP05147.1 transcriptional repressor [Spirochaetota bacterium]
MTVEDEKTIYKNYISKYSIRKSKQREKILEIFLGSEGHLTIQELFQIAREKYKNIGIATIYRAMKIFCGAGLAEEVDVGDGNKRYEHKYNHNHHDHLICEKCGKIIEFSNNIIEKIQQDICNKLGFKPTSHKLQINGICKECQKGGNL